MVDFNSPEVLEKLKNGDYSTFELLFNNYKNIVINTCYKFLLNKEDAEDVAQIVFIEVYKSFKSFKGNSSLSTWIYRIAVSKSLDHIRKNKRQKRGGFFSRIFGNDDNDIFDSISSLKNPEVELLENEKMKIIEYSLNKLPENQRIAFTLSKVKGFSNKEIAEILSTSIKAVESLMVRAKRSLKLDLTDFFEKY